MTAEDLIFPRRVRSFLYIVTVISAPIMAYLSAAEIAGPNEMALYAGITGAIALLARLNLTPSSVEGAKE